MELPRSYAQLLEFLAGSGAPGPACPHGARFAAPTPIPCRGPSMSMEFPPPGEYSRPVDLVVDNLGQRTYRDACGSIYDVSVADVCQAGHVGWPGSSPANETSIPKPSEYLFDRRLYPYGEFIAERSRPVSPSFPRRLPTCRSIQ
ncbi:unnamed protein product [Victoria cruziana]